MLISIARLCGHCKINYYQFIYLFDSENDITDVLDSTFSVENDRFGELVVVDLIPNGRNIPVTEENKKEYVNLIIEWRIIKRVEEQFRSLQEGFHEIIPFEAISIFDERELELLIGGMAEIDIEDWQKHTDYRNCSANDQIVQWFWKVLHA